MYRIATLNDMVELVAWKKHQGDKVPGPWDLKAFGNLLCEKYIEDLRPQRILEAGVGFNSRFHDLVDGSVEYWTIDKAGFYDPDRFRRGVEARHRATHVDGLLGDFLPGLPDTHFDFSFSISALEHSEAAGAPAICRDLYRITEPGGLTVHTIDTPAHRPTFRLEPWHDAFLGAGFEYIEPPDLSWGSRGHDGLAVLVEPLDTQVNYYTGRPDFGSTRTHCATIRPPSRSLPDGRSRTGHRQLRPCPIGVLLSIRAHPSPLS